MEYKLNFQIKNYVILLVLITTVGHLLMGEYFNFYNRTKYYDRYLHIFGSFSFSLFLYSILSKMSKPNVLSKFYISIFVVAIGISFGVLLEIFEFVLDSIRKTNNQKGLKDTDFDLICDVFGSILAGALSLFITL